MEEMIDLLHNYMISIRVWSSRENARDILLCAMALLQDKGGWTSPEDSKAIFMIGFDAWVRGESKKRREQGRKK